MEYLTIEKLQKELKKHPPETRLCIKNSDETMSQIYFDLEHEFCELDGIGPVLTLQSQGLDETISFEKQQLKEELESIGGCVL